MQVQSQDIIPIERDSLGPVPTPSQQEYFTKAALIFHFDTEKPFPTGLYRDLPIHKSSTKKQDPLVFSWTSPIEKKNKKNENEEFTWEEIHAGKSVCKNGTTYVRHNNEKCITSFFAKKSLHCEEPSDPPNRVLTHTQSVQLGPSILQKVSMCVYFIDGEYGWFGLMIP